MSSSPAGWDPFRDARKASCELALDYACDAVMYGNGHRVEYVHRASDGHLVAIVRRTFEVIELGGPAEESADPEGS